MIHFWEQEKVNWRDVVSFVHAAESARWKVTLLGINFDINAGRSIEKHAVKRRIFCSKVTCARTMEIYESDHPPLWPQTFGCMLTSTQKICNEERESESYYLYGQLLASKRYRFVFIWVVVCLFYVRFVCLHACSLFFYCLLTCWMFRGINKKRLGLNRGKIIDLIARKLCRSQAEAS